MILNAFIVDSCFFVLLEEFARLLIILYYVKAMKGSIGIYLHLSGGAPRLYRRWVTNPTVLKWMKESGAAAAERFLCRHIYSRYGGAAGNSEKDS